MKKYVYFICAALHFKNEILMFYNCEFSLCKKISSSKDIHYISSEIKKQKNSDELVLVSIVNYQILREEE